MNYDTLNRTQTRSSTMPCGQWSEVTSLWRSQPWVADATRAMAKLAALRSNWDRQESPPPLRSAFATLNRVVRELDAFDLPSPHISPVSGGGLGIEWHEGRRTLSIEILPEGTLEYLKAEMTSQHANVDKVEDGIIPLDRINEARRLVRWLLNG